MLRLSRVLLIACLSTISISAFSPVLAEEIRYAEDFALARNRAEALKQLIPGTQDYCNAHESEVAVPPE